MKDVEMSGMKIRMFYMKKAYTTAVKKREVKRSERK